MAFWKSLGKGLLKVAPFAAMAIPGIGPLASMAIQGGLGAANAKASGGGWKDALLGAGTGAATAGIGGGAAGKGVGGFLKQAGKNVLSQGLARGIGPSQTPSLNNRVGLPDYVMNMQGRSGGIGPSPMGDMDFMGAPQGAGATGGFQAALAAGQQDAMNDPLRRMLAGGRAR